MFLKRATFDYFFSTESNVVCWSLWTIGPNVWQTSARRKAYSATGMSFNVYCFVLRRRNNIRNETTRVLRAAAGGRELV